MSSIRLLYGETHKNNIINRMWFFISSDIIAGQYHYPRPTTKEPQTPPTFYNINTLMNQDNKEQDQYFYHADHLGSSSWITDASGNVNQHLAYMPYGEQFIDERNDSHDIRFKFTGKERDRETGFDYFGARYYSSGLSVWLSVDALADKYPMLSPYIYVANNPSNFIDFNGNFIVSEEFKKKYPNFYSYLKNQLLFDVKNSINIKKQLMELGEFADWDELKTCLTSGTVADGGTGPELSAALHPGSKSENIDEGILASTYFFGGWTNINGEHNIELSSVLLDNFEKAFSADNLNVRKYALMYVFTTLLHETVHYGDITHGENRNGKISHEKTAEIGDAFEWNVWRNDIGAKNAETQGSMLLQYKRSVHRVFQLMNYHGTDLHKEDLPTTSKRKHPPMYDSH